MMRYYEPGDDIYIFGFSRGAYTARFLAEMLHNIGLLSRGNEEMVYFAWDTFSKFQVSKGVVPIGKAEKDMQDYMTQFKKTFCKHIEVHFLGLFDCVNSVGQFEVPLFRKSFNYTSTPPAAHIRHAVALHERRLKFRPALCLFNDMDPNNPLKLDEPGEQVRKEVDLGERWFAGNHGDVGGGWDPTPAPAGGNKEDAWLLSDMTLKWMVDEMTSTEVTGDDPERKLKLDKKEQEKHLAMAGKLIAADGKKWLKPKPIRTHDMLKWGRGSEWYMWIVWWIIGTYLLPTHQPLLFPVYAVVFAIIYMSQPLIKAEILPISSRLELQRNGLWKPKYFPSALGSRRGIPKGAKIHASVTNMMECGILGADMQWVEGAPPGFWDRLRGWLGVRKSGVQEARERYEERNGTA